MALYNCINNYNIPYKQQKPDIQTGCMKHVLHTNCHSTELVKTTTRQLQFSTVGCNPSVYAQMINSHSCIHAAAHFPIYIYCSHFDGYSLKTRRVGKIYHRSSVSTAVCRHIYLERSVRLHEPARP